MKRTSYRSILLGFGLVFLAAWRCEALIYCVTNGVDVHQSAPTGEWAHSGWQATVPIDIYLGTAIASNALLTAKHLWHIGVGKTFVAEGTNHTVTVRVDDAGSDLAVLFFTPSMTKPISGRCRYWPMAPPRYCTSIPSSGAPG